MGNESPAILARVGPSAAAVDLPLSLASVGPSAAASAAASSADFPTWEGDGPPSAAAADPTLPTAEHGSGASSAGIGFPSFFLTDQPDSSGNQHASGGSRAQESKPSSLGLNSSSQNASSHVGDFPRPPSSPPAQPPPLAPLQSPPQPLPQPKALGTLQKTKVLVCYCLPPACIITHNHSPFTYCPTGQAEVACLLLERLDGRVSRFKGLCGGVRSGSDPSRCADGGGSGRAHFRTPDLAPSAAAARQRGCCGGGSLETSSFATCNPRKRQPSQPAAAAAQPLQLLALTPSLPWRNCLVHTPRALPGAPPRQPRRWRRRARPQLRL